MLAVRDADLLCVRRLLAAHGSSISNHCRQLRISNAFGLHDDRIWDDQGNPWLDDNVDQPFTPLRLVVFRISDCCLTLAQLDAFRVIAQLLVCHGADAVGAREYMISRYGEPASGAGETDTAQGDDSTIFNHVWEVVCAAADVQIVQISSGV